MKLTTEEVLAQVRAEQSRDYNNAGIQKNMTLLSRNTERDCNHARVINIQCSNIEYSNVASNLADNSARDWLATPTSSSLGEVKREEALGQEEKGFKAIEEAPPRAINNPAEIWGIDAQQLIKSTKPKSFHITIQTYGQVESKSFTNYTVYTYLYDRLRAYKPETNDEQNLLALGRARKDIAIGRVTRRGRKGDIIDGLLAYVEQVNGYDRLTLIYGDNAISIDLTNPPTQYQNKIYSHTGHYGQAIAMPSKRNRISFQDSLTYSGDKDE